MDIRVINALLVAALCVVCLGQNVMTRPAEEGLRTQAGRVQNSARIVMEDGTAPPADLTVSNAGACMIRNVFGGGTVTLEGEWCTVWVMGPGVRSQWVVLKNRAEIALKRLGEHEGSMISITVLKAPAAAKKAYGNGVEVQRRKKMQEARKQFQQAVKIYPNYALAWSELGGLLRGMGDVDGARAALQEATRADKMYLKPMVQLAALEAGEER